LRPLLADAAVLKVLHGGVNDVLWLQRDAHLYMVNVFDTEKAALVSALAAPCLRLQRHMH
jgi:ribonuclease D